MRIPTIVPVSDLRQDVASVLEKLQESKEPLVITQRGRAVAVLQSIAAYEKQQHDFELLKTLMRGLQEIEEGVGYSWEEVMRRGDELLKQKQEPDTE